MGCGGSTLNPDHQRIPARFRPILRRRLEEIRARRNGDTTNGLSKKELLGEATTSHASSEEVQEEVHNEEVISQDCPPLPQKISIDASSKPVEEEAPNDNDCETMPLYRAKSLDQCLDDKKVVDVQSFHKRHASVGSIEEEIVSDYYDPSELGPGSPSFRVYCMALPEDKEDSIDNEHIDDENNSAECQENSVSRESSSSNEVSVRQTPKKGRRRGRRFIKMTIPKGGKHILNNMHSFYNFPCSSQGNNPQLLQKAAA